MAKDDDNMQQMLDMWQQGQDAFIKAQKDAVESFGRAFSETGTPDIELPGDEMMRAWQDFASSWAPAWDPSVIAGAFGGQNPFLVNGEALHGLINPGRWMNQFPGQLPDQLINILDNIAQGPRFADLATPQIGAAEAWREAIGFQRAAAEFSKVMQDAWARAYRIYSEKHTLEELQSGEVKEALDSWLKVANEVLLETQATPEFMDAQKMLIRASTEIKVRQREMAEAWSETYQMPTRTEIDDMAKIVHELRREVRMLKRELVALKAEKK